MEVEALAFDPNSNVAAKFDECRQIESVILKSINDDQKESSLTDVLIGNNHFIAQYLLNKIPNVTLNANFPCKDFIKKSNYRNKTVISPCHVCAEKNGDNNNFGDYLNFHDYNNSKLLNNMSQLKNSTEEIRKKIRKAEKKNHRKNRHSKTVPHRVDHENYSVTNLTKLPTYEMPAIPVNQSKGKLTPKENTAFVLEDDFGSYCNLPTLGRTNGPILECDKYTDLFCIENQFSRLPEVSSNRHASQHLLRDIKPLASPSNSSECQLNLDCLVSTNMRTEQVPDSDESCTCRNPDYGHVCTSKLASYGILNPLFDDRVRHQLIGRGTFELNYKTKKQVNTADVNEHEQLSNYPVLSMFSETASRLGIKAKDKQESQSHTIIGSNKNTCMKTNRDQERITLAHFTGDKNCPVISNQCRELQNLKPRISNYNISNGGNKDDAINSSVSAEIAIPFTPNDLQEELMYPKTDEAKIIQNYNAREQDFVLGELKRKPRKIGELALVQDSNGKIREVSSQMHQNKSFQKKSNAGFDTLYEKDNKKLYNMAEYPRILEHQAQTQECFKPIAKCGRSIRSTHHDRLQVKRCSLPESATVKLDNYDRDEYIKFKECLQTSILKAPSCLRFNCLDPCTHDACINNLYSIRNGRKHGPLISAGARDDLRKQLEPRRSSDSDILPMHLTNLNGENIVTPVLRSNCFSVLSDKTSPVTTTDTRDDLCQLDVRLKEKRNAIDTCDNLDTTKNHAIESISDLEGIGFYSYKNDHMILLSTDMQSGSNSELKYLQTNDHSSLEKLVKTKTDVPLLMRRVKEPNERARLKLNLSNSLILNSKLHNKCPKDKIQRKSLPISRSNVDDECVSTRGINDCVGPCVSNPSTSENQAIENSLAKVLDNSHKDAMYNRKKTKNVRCSKGKSQKLNAGKMSEKIDSYTDKYIKRQDQILKGTNEYINACIFENSLFLTNVSMESEKDITKEIIKNIFEEKRRSGHGSSESSSNRTTPGSPVPYQRLVACDANEDPLPCTPASSLNDGILESKYKSQCPGINTGAIR